MFTEGIEFRRTASLLRTYGKTFTLYMSTCVYTFLGQSNAMRHIFSRRFLSVTNATLFLTQEVYPDPEAFNPSRFLLATTGPDGQPVHKLNPSIRDPTTGVFGYGRRICAGKALAFASAWLHVAAILATMDVRPYVDPESGEVQMPSGEYSWGLAAYPKPRSKEAEALIRSLAMADSDH
jgi:hypothetical protein